MSLKLTGSDNLSERGRTGLDVLDHEILGDMASSLGHAGRRVEAIMKQLNASGLADEERSALLKEASEAVYAFFVQRELCGLRRHDDVIREYAIPRAVVVRLGAR